MKCQHCHAGMLDFTFETMEEAHTGMIRDPSEFGDSGCVRCHEDDYDSACDGCHTDIVDKTSNSLHTTLNGYTNAIRQRCTASFDPDASEGFKANCAGCHATCGQCHISRPTSVGGGFIQIATRTYSHRFRKTPDMNEQCTACHGSRVGTDFKGELEGNVADVHRLAGQQCAACHKSEEIHGDGNSYDHRYEVANMPRCENAECHPTLAANDYHNAHVDGFAGSANLQCQVCHSQPYKNCTNCHNLASGEKFDINPSVVQLKIAINPNAERSEYDYSVVRHTPVDPGTFEDWGLAAPNYLSRTTWQYASPHNIKRVTAQTTVADGQSCGTSCHASPDGPSGFLLRESDLYEADGVTKLVDYDANIDIVIPDDFPAKASYEPTK